MPVSASSSAHVRVKLPSAALLAGMAVRLTIPRITKLVMLETDAAPSLLPQRREDRLDGVYWRMQVEVHELVDNTSAGQALQLSDAGIVDHAVE